MLCDVVSLYPLPLLNSESWDFSWNSKIYERNGSVNSCFNPATNKTINATIPNYELKNAPAGTYKVKFGNAEKIIEITS